jgi:Flp pilus assembly protein TadD
LLCEVHYFLALVHRKRGEWQAAADALRRALFLAPSFWHASYLLAGTYARLGRSGDAARERARTRRLLSGPPPIVTFISHPLFVERFGITAVEVRRHSAMWPAG